MSNITKIMLTLFTTITAGTIFMTAIYKFVYYYIIKIFLGGYLL